MASFAAYGKIPALGDFFRLNAPTDFVTPWDGWLQDTLLAAAAVLGDRFEACYMSAPIWRFALPPGVAGNQGAVGVLMPSIDRVGRRFPLTLMVPTGVAEQAALRNLLWHGDVLTALETLALDALDDLARDTLAARLAAMTLREAALPSRILTTGSSLVLSSEQPDLLCADLALDLAGGGLHRSCAWSATVEGSARLILTSGLPGPEMAARLFDLHDIFSTSIVTKGPL